MHVQVKPDVKLSSIRLNNYVTGWDYFRLALEIYLVALMLLNTAIEVRALIAVGVSTYFNFWNTVDAVRQVRFLNTHFQICEVYLSNVFRVAVQSSASFTT